VVVGLGYVGTPLAAALASKGHDVTGFDIDPDKVALINKGLNPLPGDEPGLDELLAKGVAKKRLRASLDPEVISRARGVFVAVETPVDEITHDPETKALRSALGAVGKFSNKGLTDTSTRHDEYLDDAYSS